MSYINPIWLEGQRKRWQRHDWQRFLTPAGITEEKRARAGHAAARHNAERGAEQSALRDDLMQLRWLVADLKFDLTWRRLCRKYGYNPTQLRFVGR